MPEDRRLAAIMFTDIVGYTALMGSDEDKAFKILRKNREIQRPIIKKYRGEWLKEMGDGILASFNTASDAVRCAGEIQNEAKKTGIPLRIGIHEGEVVFEGSDVLGDGVNVASRLEELAEEGCINISGAVYKDIKNKAGITAEFVEEKELKNVDEPIKVYRVKCEVSEQELLDEKPSKNKSNKLLFYLIGGLTVIIIGILIWQFLPWKKTLTEEIVIADKSIAVLPFTNDSPDKENEYFCNGMMEDILTNLQRISDLKVKSRTDVEQYRDNKKTIAIMGTELGVAYILEGSVRKAGDNLRITAQLIDVKSGDHLWAETYDGKYTDEIFNFQSNTAKKVAASLQAVIAPEEEEIIDKAPTTNIEAYDLVKRAWSNLNKYQNTQNEELRRESIELFTSALKFDSTYIQAYPILISFYMNSSELDSMIYFIKKLKKIDPNHISGYYFNGVFHYLLGNADTSISELNKAIELSNDNHVWASVALGAVYCNLKREFKKGIPIMSKAISECPQNTINIMYSWLISTLINFGDYETADHYISKSMNLKEGCIEIYLKNLVLMNQGEFKRALMFTDSICGERQCDVLCNWARFTYYLNVGSFSECEHYSKQIEKDFTLMIYYKNWTKINWAYVNYRQNRPKKADEMFKELISDLERSLDNGNFWSLFDLSRIYSFKNDKKTSLKYLREYEKYGITFGLLDYIFIDPLFENLRDDPDFIEIVNRVLEEKAKSRDEIRNLLQEEPI